MTAAAILNFGQTIYFLVVYRIFVALF